MADKLEPEEHATSSGEPVEVVLSHRARLAFRADRDSEGIALLRRGVEEGDADCQAFLASLYLEGDRGIERNPGEARRLYELAVAQYNLLGTYIYGITLYFGKGLPKEKKKGIRLVKRAALMGVGDAQVFLASCYGRWPWNGNKAAAWLLVAAESGAPDARKIIEAKGLPSKEAQQLATRISGAITILGKLLVPIDPDAALKRLEQMVDEI